MADNERSGAHRAPVLAAVIGLIAASAASATASAQVSIQGVTQGFVDAVYLYCIPGVERGERLSQIAQHGNRAELQRAPSTDFRVQSSRAQAHWFITDAADVVLIEEDPGSCEVSAYGAPVEATYQMIAQAITQPAFGYQEVSHRAPRERLVTRRAFTKSVGQDTVRVWLSGNEPGAAGTRSRFSMLTASVTRVAEQ